MLRFEKCATRRDSNYSQKIVVNTTLSRNTHPSNACNNCHHSRIHLAILVITKVVSTILRLIGLALMSLGRLKACSLEIESKTKVINAIVSLSIT